MAKAFQVDSGGTLLTSLISYFKLDDATDYYGSNNLTESGSPSYASGKIGNAVDLEDSSNQYLSTTQTMGIDGGDISMEALIKVESAPASNTVNAIFIQGNNTSKVGYWLSYFNDAGTLKLYAARGKYGTGEQAGTYTVTLTPGTFYHVVFTYNGINVKVYLDNVERISFAASGSGSTNGFAGFAIGRDSDTPTGRTWDGLVDEVGVWSRALATTEVSDLYNAGSGQTMTNAVSTILSESISVSDVLLKLPSRTLSQALSITDSILRTIQRALTESTPITDTDTNVRLVPYLASESITVSDALLKLPSRQLTETLSITDSMLRVTSRLLSETVTVVDAVLKTAARTLTDAFSVADSIVRSIGRSLSESSAITDLVSRITGRSLTEGISITDIVGRVYGRVLTETVSIIESIRRFLNNLDVRYSRKFPSNPGSYSAKYTEKGPTYEKKYPDPQ